jgi:hypothetical protein
MFLRSQETKKKRSNLTISFRNASIDDDGAEGIVVHGALLEGFDDAIRHFVGSLEVADVYTVNQHQ